MISLEDCVALSGLTEAEILAIASHEHIPHASACGLALHLASLPDGEVQVRNIIIDEIRSAQRNGTSQDVRQLLHILHGYLREHPAARPKVHPWSSVM